MSYEIEDIVNEKDLPPGRTRPKYNDLIEQWHRISAGSAIKVRIEKSSMRTAIQKKFERKFGRGAVKVREHKREDGAGWDLYILRLK